MPVNEENEYRTKVSKEVLESRKLWSSVVKNLSMRLKGDIKDIVDVQSEAISHRQSVVEEVNIYTVRIAKLSKKIKNLHKQRFEFYATSYQVKTNGTEKLTLINADLSEFQEFVDELDEYVNFLRETSKNFADMNYGVKNRIELANILGVFK